MLKQRYPNGMGMISLVGVGALLPFKVARIRDLIHLFTPNESKYFKKNL